jgi:ATP-binding cassette subfamily B protein
LSYAALAALLPKGRCWLLLGASIGLASISAALALAPALVLYVIASVFFYHSDVGGVTVMEIVFSIIGAAVVRLTALIWARLAAGEATMLVADHVRGELVAKIGALPMGILAEGRPATFAAQLLDDVERIGAFLSGPFVDITSSVAMVVAATAVLAWRDRHVAVILPLLILAGWLIGRAGGGLKPDAVEREREAREALSATVLAALRGTVSDKALPPLEPDADPVRTYAAGYRAAAKTRTTFDATTDAGWRAYAGTLPALLMLIALWLGIAGLDLPALVLVVALGLQCGGAMTATLSARHAAAPTLESVRRILATLQLPAAGEGNAQPGPEATVRFADVTFTYPGSAAPVLHDIGFVARPGTVTAIVGPSGCGKTTLMRLAAGFWTPERGSVELGGVDLEAIAGDALARRIAYVFQDVFLLNDTIGANLRLGRPDADDATLFAAARAARAHEFISALPDGYETVLGERGARLSRGERQRLQIARALLRDAPIVLLDEPTASLDPATEADIQDALAELVRGKTVLLVTHRLTTIVDADQIVVLDRHGRLEAAGTHAQVLAASPTFAQLWSDYNAAVDWSPAGEARVG